MSRAQTYELHQISLEVRDAFDIQRVLSESAHRVVYSAVHRSSGENVVIKVLRPFDHFTLCMRTLREVKLLRFFSHPNIISILDIEKPRDYESFTEIYLIQEPMDSDLHKIVRTRELSNDHCRHFIWQTLRALRAIHFAGVLHRDLQPSNLLLNENGDLKVCGFGLARATASIKNVPGLITEYVTARWYRAPVIMLSSHGSTKAIDLWSVGCILAEMLSGTPIFPGKDYYQQLALIFDVLGTPTMEDYSSINWGPARAYIRSLPFKQKIPWKRILPKASDLALDLLEQLLTFNPMERISVEEALKHPYLEPYYGSGDELNAASIPEELLNSEEKMGSLSKKHWKGEVSCPYNLSRVPTNSLAPELLYKEIIR
jgi:mitogen-activated protein kinase 1/3